MKVFKCEKIINEQLETIMVELNFSAFCLKNVYKFMANLMYHIIIP